MESILSDVAPVRPVAPYLGGKRNLARRLTALIDGQPHTTYAEPFIGMGGIFLRRRRRPASEVINDLNGDVANLFRILQVHPDALLETLRFVVTSRAEFRRQLASNPATLTDIQRAARFLYLQRLAFGGHVTGQSFGVSVGRSASFDVTKLRSLLLAVHERLAGVVIEELPWAELVERYDRPGTLFYLDPPYWASEADYGASLFRREEFAHMADVLSRIRGRFVLSINDRPETRETFKRFHLVGVDTQYSVGKGQQPAKELVITNL